MYVYHVDFDCCNHIKLIVLVCVSIRLILFHSFVSITLLSSNSQGGIKSLKTSLKEQLPFLAWPFMGLVVSEMTDIVVTFAEVKEKYYQRSGGLPSVSHSLDILIFQRSLQSANFPSSFQLGCHADLSNEIFCDCVSQISTR